MDLCLVPESDIVLEGPKGCLPHVMKRVSFVVAVVVLVVDHVVRHAVEGDVFVLSACSPVVWSILPFVLSICDNDDGW